MDLGKPVVYVSGVRGDLNREGLHLLRRLRADDEIAVIWWDDDFPGYPAIREMIAASHVMVALAGGWFLSATHTSLQWTLADGTGGFGKAVRPRRKPIAVLAYPVVPFEQWPRLWPGLLARRATNQLLPTNPDQAYAAIKQAAVAAASAN
jgi:hypothetical protein